MTPEGRSCELHGLRTLQQGPTRPRDSGITRAANDARLLDLLDHRGPGPASHLQLNLLLDTVAKQSLGDRLRRTDDATARVVTIRADLETPRAAIVGEANHHRVAGRDDR